VLGHHLLMQRHPLMHLRLLCTNKLLQQSHLLLLVDHTLLNHS
jgi:hypothetical protein